MTGISVTNAQNYNAFGAEDARVKELKVHEVKEDLASGGTKVIVTLELPITNTPRMMDIEHFFSSDAVKRVAIKAAQKEFNRQAGWSDIGRPLYFKDGASVLESEGADCVRCNIACTAAP